jgi:hypothetical protein
MLHGRVAVFDNGMPIDSFLLHADDDDDSSSDDSDDEDGTEKIMRRFGIKPAAQFTFTVTQTGDQISVSDLETVYNHIPSLTQEHVENMVMTPILAQVPGLDQVVSMPLAEPVPLAEEPVPLAEEPVPQAQSAKKRGRPKKIQNTETVPVAKKRGRPKKVSTETA